MWHVICSVTLRPHLLFAFWLPLPPHDPANDFLSSTLNSRPIILINYVSCFRVIFWRCYFLVAGPRCSILGMPRPWPWDISQTGLQTTPNLVPACFAGLISSVLFPLNTFPCGSLCSNIPLPQHALTTLLCLPRFYWFFEPSGKPSVGLHPPVVKCEPARTGSGELTHISPQLHAHRYPVVTQNWQILQIGAFPPRESAGKHSKAHQGLPFRQVGVFHRSWNPVTFLLIWMLKPIYSAKIYLWYIYIHTHKKKNLPLIHTYI